MVATLVVVVLVASVVLGFQNTRRLNEDTTWVSHTLVVLGALTEVDGHLREAESIQRTYLITGGDGVPPAFPQSINSARQSLTESKALTKDNAEQLARLNELEKQIDALRDFWTQTMNVRTERGFEAAREILKTGQSPRMMAALQSLLQQIKSNEKQLLDARSLKSASTYQSALISGAVTGILALMGVVAFIVLMQRHLTARIAAAAVIAEQRERLRTTLASIGDAVIATDVDGRITTMNAVAEALTGWTIQEASGMHLDSVFRIVNEETRRPVTNPAMRALREGVIVGLANHTVLISKQETECPIDDSAAPIRCKDGEIVGCVLVFRDITERHRVEAALRESERRYRAIGEAIDFGIWVCDVEGRNTYASNSFLRMVGLTLEQCSGYNWANLLHPDDSEKTVAAWKECVKNGGVWDREHRFKGVDGQWHYVLARGVPVRDDAGTIKGWAGINLDISRLKQAEQQLQDTDRRKDEFLAILAHELRNPLAPVRNALLILRSKNANDSELEWARNVIDRQIQQMTRLIDDLMDVSRISRDKLELRRERIELSKAVRDAVEISRPLIDQQQHQLIVNLPSEPVMLDADPTRLGQVLWNLLNNAAKYTEKGGRIELSAARRGSDVVLILKDSGIGIPASHLPTLFTMFSQVEGALSRSQGGLGIGLCLVRRLVEMHGGTIEARSDGLGQGSEFIVRLPAIMDSESASSKPASSGEVPIASSKHKVLVVDDNRDSASSMAMLLGMMGNNVRSSYDGEEAVQAAREFLPHIVLLDIGLPKLNGYEVAQRIRQEPWGQKMFLVAVTGWGQDDDKRKAKDAGFDQHLVKPVDPTLLMNLLAELPAVET